MNNRRVLLLTIIVCLIPAAAGLVFYGSLPSEIAVQWSSGGQVSNYAPKWFAVLGMPIFFALFNLYCHYRTDSTHKERNYPEVMIWFLKWVIPFLSVICVGLSLTSALERPMYSAGVMAFLGTALILLGSVIYEKGSLGVGFLKIIENGNSHLTGSIYIIGGIVSAFTADIGYAVVSLVITVIAVVIGFAAGKIVHKF